MARDYPQAERFLREGLAYCAEHDIGSGGTYLEAWQARASFEQGNWDDTAQEATRVLNHSRLPAVTKIPALTILGWVRVRRGDPGSMPILDEACTLALATGEPQQIAPVAAARAEAAWLRGNRDQCLAETHVGYDLALAQTDPWKVGELSLWMWRAGGLTSATGPIAEPFARQISGEWRRAAALWEQMGCPYEQALALFERLGAQPAAAILRQRFRQ